MRSGRRECRTVGGRRDAVRPREARGEGPDTSQPDGEADLDDRAVRRAQQCGGALEPTRQQVGVWRLPEGLAELAAEMGPRKSGRRREIIDAERIRIAGIRDVFGA
jgi:hypothetical protein